MLSINTDTQEANIWGQTEVEVHLGNAFPSAGISDPESMQACAAQQQLYESGAIAPETHTADYNPFYGEPVGYYVTINTHISGDLSNPSTVNSAVAIVTAQVTDAQGNVLYEQKMTFSASQGMSLDQISMQASASVVNFFKSIANQNK
jgi:hypothetical protein